MERNAHALVSQLKTGDRFYRLKDKHKHVWQIVEHVRKETRYQTYKYWAVPVSILNGFHDEDFIMKQVRAVNGATEVIFLRSTLQSESSNS